VVATDILLSAIGGDAVANCAFLRCGDQLPNDWWTAQIHMLVLFSIVLFVRVLFLMAEHALLLRMISYYQRVAVIQATHSTNRGSSLVVSGGTQLEGVSAVGTTIGFEQKVRELLGGKHSWTIHVVMISIVVQVTYWSADYKMSRVLDDPNIYNILANNLESPALHNLVFVLHVLY
jgi:hypothetical protein